MPIYDFKSNDGKKLEKLVPLGTDSVTEDGVTYNRVPNLSGFAFTGNAVGVPPQKEQVRDGYHKLEQKEGSGFLRKSPFTAKQIKRAWGF